MQRLCYLVVALTFLGLSVHAGNKGEKARTTKPVIMIDDPVPGSDQVFTPQSIPVGRSGSVGTYTGLSGFYDYQSNGGGVRHIDVDPSDGAIHVVYMLAEDSAAVATSRRTGYAYSTDNGVTWDTFGNIRVPNRASGFPTLTLGKGDIEGAAIIANHSVTGGLNRTLVSIDFPAGQGVFSELSTQDNNPAGEPIWPYVAAGTDGSIVTHSSINNPGITNQSYVQRTTDFSSWSTWLNLPQPNGIGGRNPIAVSASGKMGTIINPSAPSTHDGSFWIESTNNGETWPSSLVEIYPDGRVAGDETLGVWVGTDVIYDANENPIMAFNTSRLSETGFFFAGSRVEFWSQATGFVDAAPWDSTLYPSSMVPQTNHLALGYPAITTSGNRIVILFMAFPSDTTHVDTATGMIFGEIFYVQSSDGGMTWTDPVNLTNTPQLDERYPSVSKWNPEGFVHVTWQEDLHAGSHAFTDNAPISRSHLVYHKIDLNATSIGDQPHIVAAEFKLSQNYPNPFNPVTKINFRIPTSSDVKLTVFNTLGQEVATLVDGFRMAGEYSVDFSGEGLPSGMYFYAVRAGAYSSVKKMMLLK